MVCAAVGREWFAPLPPLGTAGKGWGAGQKWWEGFISVAGGGAVVWAGGWAGLQWGAAQCVFSCVVEGSCCTSVRGGGLPPPLAKCAQCVAWEGVAASATQNNPFVGGASAVEGAGEPGAALIEGSARPQRTISGARRPVCVF